MTIDQRRYPTWRRDLNNIVRDESGEISGTKIGTLVGQWIAAKYLLVHYEKVLQSWESMVILFSILIAPQMFLKLLNMKYGGVDEKPAPVTTVTTATAETVTTTKGKK